MSRRSRRLARRRHAHNRTLRARRSGNHIQRPQLRYASEELARRGADGWLADKYAAVDRLATLGFDVREDHDALDAVAAALLDGPRPQLWFTTTAWQPDSMFRRHVLGEWRGAEITYAEIDDLPVCVTEAGWCLREAGHEGPHVYNPKEQQS